MVREYRYPVEFERNTDGRLEPKQFDLRELGLILDVAPSVSNGKIVLTGAYRITDFSGFIKNGFGSWTPAFETRDGRILRELGSGESAGFWLPGVRSDENEDERINKRVFVLLSARLVEAGTPR